MNALVPVSRPQPGPDQMDRLAQELAKRIVVETKLLDPRDNVTVGQVIEKHLRFYRDEVGLERHQTRVTRLRDMAAKARAAKFPVRCDMSKSSVPDSALPKGTIVQPIQCAYLAFLRVTY